MGGNIIYRISNNNQEMNLVCFGFCYCDKHHNKDNFTLAYSLESVMGRCQGRNPEAQTEPEILEEHGLLFYPHWLLDIGTWLDQFG